MNTASFPNETLSGYRLLKMAREIGAGLSQYVQDEESHRRPSIDALNELRTAGFLKLFLPISLGGMEADPLTAAKVVEEVAMHNTTAGWSMMVANTATWWCSRLSDEGIDEVFRDGPDTFIAGAFHPPMRAIPVENGYVINGRSPLASNVHQAQWIFVTAFVVDQDEISLRNGTPEIIGVFMRPDHCLIPDTWHTIGMRGTDSNDVVASDVFVPARLSYPLVPSFNPNRHYTGKLYRFPAIGAGIASLIVPVSLAVACNAISELKLLADKKVPFGSSVSLRQRGTVQRKLGIAEACVQSGRAWLHQVLSAVWKKTAAGETLSLEDRALLLLAATHTNQTCSQAVDLMYSAAGTSAIYNSNRLSRYFCDAQVIRHHGFANESRYETAAQVLLGLPPDLPVIMF